MLFGRYLLNWGIMFRNVPRYSPLTLIPRPCPHFCPPPSPCHPPSRHGLPPASPHSLSESSCLPTGLPGWPGCHPSGLVQVIKLHGKELRRTTVCHRPNVVTVITLWVGTGAEEHGGVAHAVEAAIAKEPPPWPRRQQGHSISILGRWRYRATALPTAA